MYNNGYNNALDNKIQAEHCELREILLFTISELINESSLYQTLLMLQSLRFLFDPLNLFQARREIACVTCSNKYTIAFSMRVYFDPTSMLEAFLLVFVLMIAASPYCNAILKQTRKYEGR